MRSVDTETDALTTETTVHESSDADASTDEEATCGDAIVESSEDCDDGNIHDGDGCSGSCTIEDGWSCEGSTCRSVCGDGTIVATEVCDDGNLRDGDGCDASCSIEDGFTCESTPSDCRAVCGDGRILGTEACDDDDVAPGDGCSETCMLEAGWSCAGTPSACSTGCGDGIVAGMETCDDLGLVAGDGCSPGCAIEDGWQCANEPSACESVCGDGLIVGIEACDDGGLASADGCDNTCQVELGWTCQAAPSHCETHCGDGLIAGIEQCDDGDLTQGDGCSLFCAVDFGWSCVDTPSTCSESATLQSVSLGGTDGCVLTTTGELGCFGENLFGAVGNGTNHIETYLPTFAMDHVVAVTAGGAHNCVLRDDGTVWCWGHPSSDQLGPLGAYNDNTLPVEVTGLPEMTLVVSGSLHVCAIDIQGAVWCWGGNSSGQLGRSTITISEPIPEVAPMPDGLAAVDLALGFLHSCALLSDGQVACWGDDEDGQLGDGVAIGVRPFAERVTGMSGIADVNTSAGSSSTCAADGDGQLFCWGDNTNSTLGIGNNTDSPVPMLVELPAAVYDFDLAWTACALLVDDSVYCWGHGLESQLGYGDLATQSLPLEIEAMPPTGLVDIELGGAGTCVITAEAERYCWGLSERGYLGIAPAYQVDPSPVLFTDPPVAVVLDPSERYGVTCGVMANGTVQCAGEAATSHASPLYGAQGYFHPLTQHLTVPTTLPAIEDALAMEMGNGFACIRTASDVHCWGNNQQRSLGRGDIVAYHVDERAPVIGLGSVDEIALGGEHACARIGGTVQCWGDNSDFQTGFEESTQDQSVPVGVADLVDATALSLGENHSCALRPTSVVCWGDDGLGQLGDDDNAPDDTGDPVTVIGLPDTVTQIDLGQDHACALAEGTVYCWGANAHGQLGQGNKVNWDIAMPVPGLPPIVQISVGWNHSCARSEPGDLWCWGYAYDGHLGDGGWLLTGGDDVTLPTPFGVASGIDEVVAGNSHTCIRIGTEWSCVGFPASGQLGDGTTLEPSFPRPTPYGL